MATKEGGWSVSNPRHARLLGRQGIVYRSPRPLKRIVKTRRR